MKQNFSTLLSTETGRYLTTAFPSSFARPLFFSRETPGYEAVRPIFRFGAIAIVCEISEKMQFTDSRSTRQGRKRSLTPRANAFVMTTEGRRPKCTQPELDFSKSWKMSDLILSVEGQKLHVHKAILAISSPVFIAMLSSNFREKNEAEIPLPGKKVEEIKDLLRAIYPCEHVITRHNCNSLLKLSCEYQMDQLKKRCEKFVLDTYKETMDTCSSKEKCEEALHFVLMSQQYQLSEKVVQCCMSKFVSQQASWENLKANKIFSQLDPLNKQRVAEERVRFLETCAKKCTCEAWPHCFEDQLDAMISRNKGKIARLVK